MTRITLSLTERNQNSIIIRDGHQNPDNDFMTVAHKMGCDITEDPKRVIYPTLGQERYLPTLEAGNLQDIELIAARVFTALFNQQKVVYKTINHPIYEREDTEHILNEIDALTRFRGVPNIAQLLSIVISDNPYKTCPSTDMPPVITGFLLEHYPGGTLDERLKEKDFQLNALPIQWAVQIGTALEALHERGRTHIDIKLSNIVFDANNNAILIDVSGTGGYTWEWLAPETQILIRQDEDLIPATAPFEARVATDCWAYGRILTIIAEKVGTDGTGEKWQLVADGLTKPGLESRTSLRDALTQLNEKK